MSTAKTLAKGTAWGFIGLFVIRFIGFFYCIILARLFSQEEIGSFFLVLSVINILTLFSNLGLGSGAVARYVPFYAGKKKFNHVRAVLKTSLSVGVIFSLVFMVFIILSSGHMADLFHEQRLTPLFCIMAFYLLIYNLYSTALKFLTGRKLIKLNAYMQISQVTGKLILTIIFLLTIGSVAESIAFGFLLSFAFTMLLGWYWTVKEYMRLPESREPVDGYALLKDMVPFGLTMVFLSSLFLINAEFDRIMLGYFLPGNNTMMIGIYTIVVSFSGVILIFAGAVSGMFHPMVTEVIAKKDFSGVSDTSLIAIRWIAFSTIPVLLIILVFPKNILGIVYGREYEIGYLSLMLYSLGLFVYAFAHPIQDILSGMKRLDVTLKIAAFAALINIVINLFLIPAYGIDGAALASTISYWVMTLLLICTRKTTHLRIPRDIHKPAIAGTLTILPLILLKPFVGDFMALIPSLVVPTSIIDEIIVKILKVSVLGILTLIAGMIYIASLTLLKAFAKEDIEILSAAMIRFKLPGKLITMTERILLR